jgi:Protein of unknown function (DUF3429)
MTCAGLTGQVGTLIPPRMRLIPRSALILGLAGLIPFLWAAATHLSPAIAGWALGWLPPGYVGAYLGLTYGAVILAFMSGVIWGFATRATGRQAAVAYGLSVIPALWVFFAVRDGSDGAIIRLMAGFAGLLMLDAQFAAQRLAPDWWMPLRILLTVIVLACLGATLL